MGASKKQIIKGETESGISSSFSGGFESAYRLLFCQVHEEAKIKSAKHFERVAAAPCSANPTSTRQLPRDC